MEPLVTIELSFKVIKKLRLERDLSLEDVSSKSRLHVGFLRELEEKKQSPHFDIIPILVPISKAFEMDFVELFKLVSEDNEALINQIKVEGD